MKLSFVSLILSAGLAISQVSAAPIRIAVVSGSVGAPNGFVRVGHGVTIPHHPPNVATMHTVNKVSTKTRHGCAGSFRVKAMQLSDWFRHTLGLPPVIKDAKAVVVSHSMLPVEVGSPNGGPSHHVHYSAHAQTFVQRLTRALMMLGPWEGRAVSFILGCGIGVLVRMIWVLAVLAIRSVRGNKKEEEEFLGDEVIFEEEEQLLPPQYVETETVVKEKDVSIKAT